MPTSCAFMVTWKLFFSIISLTPNKQASALTSYPVLSILKAFILDETIGVGSVLSDNMIVGRSRTAYSFEKERAPRPILEDVVNISNNGLLITSSGKLYRKYPNGKLRRYLKDYKISNANMLNDDIIASDDKGNAFRYNVPTNSIYPLISQSTHSILEISVGISHALFRTSSGLVLVYGT